MRAGLEPTDDRVFTTGSPDNGKVLLKYLQVAWQEMDLTGTPTFTDIRTAVATHVGYSFIYFFLMFSPRNITCFTPLSVLFAGQELPQPGDSS